MIRVNLLPPELRAPVRTPLAKMFLIILGTVLVAASVILLFAVQVVWRPSLEQQRVDKEDDKARKTARVAEIYDKLQDEISDYESRSRAIAEITGQRVNWAKKLDQLCSLIPRDVWLDAMDLQPPRTSVGRSAEGPTLKLDCHVIGDDESRIADFLRMLKHDDPDREDFFDDFLLIEDPGWKAEEFTDFQERIALSFGLTLHMKPLGAAYSPKKTPTKAR